MRRMRLAAAATLLSLVACGAQCPRSCSKLCAPPKCGPRCCEYYERLRTHGPKPPQVSDLLWKNSTLPEWAQRCRTPVERVSSCAAHWASTLARRQGRTPVVLVAMFKSVSSAHLLRFVEYHLLLGASRAILVDNNCGNRTTEAREALAGHIAAGTVTLIRHFQCIDMKTMMFMHGFRGGSAMARQLSGLVGVPRQSLIVAIDDDEYMVVGDPALDLSDFADEMARRKVVAVTLNWRVFGTSGHLCQPMGPLLHAFVRRGKLLWELNSTEEELAVRRHAKALNLNTPFGGKPAYTFLDPFTPNCGTHMCHNTPPGYLNCAQEEGPNPSCEAHGFKRLSARVWVNHYAFQSASHWEAKKLRGRTNSLPSRRGEVPAFYESVHDDSAISLFHERVTALSHPPLRACLRELFGEPTVHHSLDSVLEAGETAAGRPRLVFRNALRGGRGRGFGRGRLRRKVQAASEGS